MKRILIKGWILHLFNWTSNFTNKPVHLWVLLVWNQEIFLATWEIFHIKLFTKLFYEHHVCMSLLVIKLSLYNCWSNYSQGFFQEHMSKKNSLSDIVRSWCFVSLSLSYNIDLLWQTSKIRESSKYLVITTVNFFKK